VQDGPDIKGARRGGQRHRTNLEEATPMPAASLDDEGSAGRVTAREEGAVQGVGSEQGAQRVGREVGFERRIGKRRRR